MDQRTCGGEHAEMVSIDVLRDLVHDLRTPLVAASGFLTLLERADGGPAADRYAASLRESIEALKEILERSRALYSRVPRA